MRQTYSGESIQNLTVEIIQFGWIHFIYDVCQHKLMEFHIEIIDALVHQLVDHCRVEIVAQCMNLHELVMECADIFIFGT